MSTETAQNQIKGILGEAGAFGDADPQDQPNDEHNEQPPASDPPAAAAQDEHDAGLDDLADELGIPAPGSDGERSEDSEKSGLEALAEKAGVSLDDLYEAEISLGDEREPITLGELKDRARALERLEDERADFDDERMEGERKLVQARAEINEVIRLLPRDAITPELLAKAKANWAGMINEQRQEMYRIMPAWRDADTYAQAKEEIFAAVSDYGFQRVEIDSLYDGRLLKLAHDFGRLRKRLADAKASVKREVPEVPNSARRRSSSDKGKANKDGRIADAVERGKQAPRGSEAQSSAISEVLTLGSGT